MSKHETGPIYGVKLIDTLPLGTGGMSQQMPSRNDLEDVRQMSQRTAAGYEVLLSHYQQSLIRILSLEDILSRVAGFANKISRSGMADRARAGNDMLELLAQLEFNSERNQSGEEKAKANPPV